MLSKIAWEVAEKIKRYELSGQNARQKKLVCNQKNFLEYYLMTRRQGISEGRPLVGNTSSEKNEDPGEWLRCAYLQISDAFKFSSFC